MSEVGMRDAGMTGGGDVAAREEIVGCLGGIRRRLWGVRVVEQVAMAVIWGGGVGMVLMAAGFLRERYFGWSVVVAMVPWVGAVWAWMQGMRLAGKRWGGVRVGETRGVMRVGAIMTAVMSVGMVGWMLWAMKGGAGTGRVQLWVFGVAAVGIFVALAVGSVRMIDMRAAAIFVDQRVGLRERVATALEMLERNSGEGVSGFEKAFQGPVIASAVTACQEVKGAKVGYGRLDQRVYAGAAAMAIAVAGLSLLTPLSPEARGLKKTFVVVQTNAKSMQEVLKEMEEKRPVSDKVTADKLKPLQQALTQLQQGNMSPIESSALLDQAKEQMKRDQEEMSASEKVQQMLKQMEGTQDLAKASDAAKDAHTGEAEGKTNAGEQKTAAEQAISSAAKAAGDKMKSGQMSADEKKNLAEGLEKAAKAAGADPQLQKDLQSAADAAKNGDADKMAQSLAAAGDRMGEQRGDQQTSQDSVNRAMSEIDRMEGNGFSNQEQSTMGENGNQGGQQGQNGQSGQSGQQGGGGDNSGSQQGKAQASGGNGGQKGDTAKGQQGEGKGSGGERAMQNSGSTMFEQKGGPGDHNQGDKVGGTGSFVRIYDQRQIESRGAQEKVASHINPLGGPAAGTSEVMGNADKNDSVVKTYADVLPDARQKMMDELDRQEIPPQYQDMVKAFYEK